MEYIFHEKQEGSLCAQHCLNALLQGDYFSAVDLATIASQMDEAERKHMAEGGVNSEDYQKFLQQPSENMDDSGYFSVQVIAKALDVWGLELAPFNGSHPLAKKAQMDPLSSQAFICNYRDHWLTVRRLGNQWFNLNSLLSGPELISNTYLAMFLTQLQVEGYSIFLTIGDLPDNEADNILNVMPAVQTKKPTYLNASKSSSSSGSNVNSINDAEDTDLQKALRLSLQETDKDFLPTEGGTVEDIRWRRQAFLERVCNSKATDEPGCETKTNEQNQGSSTSVKRVESMTEEEMLEAAMKMSMGGS